MRIIDSAANTDVRYHSNWVMCCVVFFFFKRITTMHQHGTWCLQIKIKQVITCWLQRSILV